MEDLGSARVVAGRYRLDRVVGTGGAGTVWQAFDQRLERVVAVKELVWSPGGRDDIRGRALVEARAAAALPDPGIIRVYDVVEEPSVVYLVLEFVEAPSLAEVVLDHGPLPDDEAAQLAEDVLGTLSLAHAEGIVHRDVKPSNVLLDDRRPRLADFGIARIADEPHLTSTGLVVGTPAYMAPEQARGEDATPATDRYGLGATLFFALEGEPPFDGDGTLPTVLAVLNEEPRQMRRTGALAELARALMAKDPADRPSTAEARERLTAILDELGDAPRRMAEMGEMAARARAALGVPPAQPAAADEPAADDLAAAAPPATSTAAGERDDARAETPSADPATAVVEHSAAVAPSSLPLDRTTAAPATPAPDPDSVAPASTEVPRRRRRSLSVAALVLLTVVGMALAATLTRAGDQEADAGPPGQITTADDLVGSGIVPAHWVQLAPEQAPYSLRHPPDWEVAADEGLVELNDPASGALLRVEWSTRVVDPLSWVGRRSAALSEREGYEHLRVSSTRLGQDSAALWEYEYESDTGEPRHARDLAVRHADEYVLAVSLRAPRERWEQMSPLWDPITASLKLEDLES